MRRVMIVGCPGAGKSTAARRLAEVTGLPIIHLDRHYWLAGWVRPDPQAWRAKVEELASQPCWIMDGNYGSTFAPRLSAADTVLHLDFSTFVCTSRLVRRTLGGLGGQRDGELGDGCLERLDWPFFRFVLGYRRTHRNRDLEAMSGFAGNLHRFASPRQLESFLAALAARG